MKIDISRPMKTYRGEDIKIGASGDSPTATMRELLEFVIVNMRDAEQQSADAKYRLFKLLSRIHEASVFVDVSVEELALLKRLAGPLLSVPVLGAMFDALEGSGQLHRIKEDDELLERIPEAKEE